MHREPLVARQLLVGDRGAGRGAEHLRAPAGQARHPGVPHGREHVAHRHPLEAREVGDLDGRQRLDVDVGVPLLEPAEHVEVVREAELRVEPAHDVELARGIVVRGVRLREHLVEAARVVPLFLRHSGERAEHARVPQDTDVGGIDVLVRREGDAVAVPGAVHLVGQPADREEVRRGEEREAVLARQTLAALNLLGDRDERGVLPSVRPPATVWESFRVRPSAHHAARRMASVTLWPPNPNEFDRATSTWRFTALLGAESRSQAGSGVNWLMVGGTTPVWTTSAHSAASKAPAAPSRWPVIDLVEPKISLRACGPNTVFTAAVSAESPCGVDVPWALMYPTCSSRTSASRAASRMASWAPEPSGAGAVMWYASAVMP